MHVELQMDIALLQRAMKAETEAALLRAALMDWCLQQAGITEADTVLDTHMGSGTTGLVCLRRGIPFVGCEIDPVHYATAVERLQQEASNG